MDEKLALQKRIEIEQADIQSYQVSQEYKDLKITEVEWMIRYIKGSEETNVL